MQDSDYQQNMTDTSRFMYHGTAFAAGGSQIQIPGYIAIASSQVEGTPVICNGNADAQGHLIKVYLPGNPPRSGEQGPLYIFH
jgi:hypothetical protein